MEIPLCPKCGKLLQAKDKGCAVCSCGYESDKPIEISHSTKIKLSKKVGKGVLKTNEDINMGFPNKCSKCGHGKASVANLGPQYSDESDVALYKCKKCGHVERKTDGNSSN